MTTLADAYNARIDKDIVDQSGHDGFISVARCIEIAVEIGRFTVQVYWEFGQAFAALTWVDGSSVTIGLSEQQ